ncbi:MAG: LysE family translocator [Pseudomonadota bacterium]
MDMQTFLIFTMTTFVVVFSPGPAAITAAAQGAGNGTWRAMLGVLGIAFANAVYFALSATGIASLIVASNLLFSIIKWVGVAYLLYLGVTAITSRGGGLIVAKGEAGNGPSLFLKGFAVEFANPKALLYFAAILPQFLDTSRAVLPQILIMGGVTLLIDLLVYGVYARFGQAIASSGVKTSVIRWINRTAGSALLFAAFKMSKTVA